jgi:hypothetical protein
MGQTVQLHVIHDIMALDINDHLVPEEAVCLLFQIVLLS